MHLLGKHYHQSDWALVRMLCLLERQLFCTETTVQPLLKRRKQKE